MPIRFQCEGCKQRLSIARRKAGVPIACPTCGRKQTVPSQNGDSGPIESALDKDSSSSGDIRVDRPADAPPDESASPLPPPLPVTVETIETAPPICPVPRLPPPPPAASPPPAPPTSSWSAWAIYCQALILAIVGIGGFCGGYYVGRRDAAVSPPPAPLAAEAPAPVPNDGFRNEEVLLQGRLRWMPTVGQTGGDRQAVLLLLPQDTIPSQSLPIEGLRPGEEPEEGPSASQGRIKALGGVYAKAAADGTAAAVLPREGRYHLLLISRNTSRPKEEAIRPKDLMEMKQYFGEAEELIGDRKYVWKQEEIRVGFPPIEHDFGLDGLP